MRHLEKPYFPDASNLENYEEVVLKVAKRRILKILFKASAPVPLAHLLEQARVSICSAAAVYAELSTGGKIVRTDAGFLLTEEGRRWALRNRKKIFMQQLAMTYKAKSSSFSKNTSVDHLKTLPKQYTLSRFDT